jgi:DNA polymerase-3 subunit delta'
MWRGLSKFNNPEGFLGNERIVGALLRGISTGRFAHTLLFAGPAGSGKKSLAGFVVQRLFCPDSCQLCPNCTMLARGIHPDYLHIASEGSVKLEHARQLKEFLAAPPNTAAYKVALLEDCQNLTVEAGNSLLKILEDPPQASVCILTADSADNVLPTLVSRSQVYTLAPLSREVISHALEKRNVPQQRSWFLAGFSQGVLGRALKLLEDEDFWLRRQQMATEIQEILARRRNPLQSSDNWQVQPEEALDLLESWLRDMLLSQINPDYIPVNRDLQSYLDACMRNCPADKCIALLDYCAAVREYLQTRCNPRLVFDCLALKMWEV